ncbi:MAG: ABC transporter substrate-binding protein [Gammaproteobacteria bacterium]|nr:ABC transporter substrate-binding protein [Gammaproteobacteria bacterium]
MRRPTTYLAAAALVAAGWLIEAPAPAAAAPAAAESAAAEPPSQVIQVAADGLLKALNTDRQAYRKDPSKVQALVDQYILPHVDTAFSAQLVLGRYWRTATPQQRDRFINAFYHSMLNNYGTAIVEFTSNTLKVYPTKVSAGSQNATVRTEMSRTSGAPVSVNYYMHMTPDGWKAWDVVIDGVSYVKSYREDFGSQIAQQGGNAAAIDSVINRLESGEKPPQIGKTTGRGS